MGMSAPAVLFVFKRLKGFFVTTGAKHARAGVLQRAGTHRR